MHISFVVLVECNMKQMRIGTIMLVSIDIKIENNNFTTDTDCMLLLLFHFLGKLFILCSPAHKRYGFVTINL